MPSIDELDAMITKLNLDACVEFFAKISEKDRKAFVERIEQWHDVAVAHRDNAWRGQVFAAMVSTDELPKRMQEQIKLLKAVENGEIKLPSSYKNENCLSVIELAMTACSGLTELRKIPVPSALHAFQIMRVRKPKWLDKWLNYACANVPFPCWELTRQMELEGFANAEHGDGYFIGMAPTYGQKEAEQLFELISSELILKDELIWQMLDNSSAMQALSNPTGITEQLRDRRRTFQAADWRNWTTWIEQGRRASYIWRVTLAELSKKDEAARTKLLDHIFSWLPRLSGDAESKSSSGMAGELSPAGWFQTLHDEMGFSNEEKIQYAGRYIGLLSLKDSSTLTWAIHNLMECDPKQLPLEDLLANLPRVFYLKRKDPAAASIKLLEKIQQSTPELKQQIALIAIEAFEHSSSDVHKRVLSFLKKSKAITNSEILAALDSRKEQLSGLLKKEVIELLEKHLEAIDSERSQNNSSEHFNEQESRFYEQGSRFDEQGSRFDEQESRRSVGSEARPSNVLEFRRPISDIDTHRSSDSDLESHAGSGIESASIPNEGRANHELDLKKSAATSTSTRTPTSPNTDGFTESKRALPISNSPEFLALKERAEHLQATHSRLAGVTDGITSIVSELSLSEFSPLDSMEIPRLDPSKRIARIEHLDDLIFHFLYVLEGQANADDHERLLDGLLRLCDQRPRDFEDRVSSLRKKVQGSADLFAESPRLFVFNGLSSMNDLQTLAVAWLGSKEPQQRGMSILKDVMQVFGLQQSGQGELPQLPKFIDDALNTVATLDGNPGHPPLGFFAERIKGLVRLVSKRVALPLLAAPTHQGAWIDPLVLPGRLAAWGKAHEKLDKSDTIQMLLRLAPEHRAEALKKIPPSNDETIRAIRYALGAEMQAPFNTAEIWVAAFRSREPKGTSSFLQERFPNLGPDSAVKASYQENLENYKKKPDSIFGTVWNRTESEMLPLQPVPAVKPRKDLRFFPIEILHDRNIFWDGNNIIEYYYLQDREPYLAHIGRRMALYIDSQGEYWKSSWNCLFDPDVSLNEMGAFLLLFGLSAKQADAARLALDAIISAIEEGRIESNSFGSKMARTLASEKITLSRWITAFKEIVRISPLHLHFITCSIETCLAGMPAGFAAKAPIPLIELLYDSCLSTGYAITNLKARHFLESVGGKGKAAKLAKLLTEIKKGKEQKHQRLVQLQILELRIQRAERWQSWQEQHSSSEAPRT